MIRRPPRSTRTDTLFPYTTLFRSAVKRLGGALARRIAGEAPILNQPGDGLGTLQAEDEAGKLEPCRGRSEEHTSELQSLMRISYAVFCLKKKTTTQHQSPTRQPSHTTK